MILLTLVDLHHGFRIKIGEYLEESRNLWGRKG